MDLPASPPDEQVHEPLDDQHNGPSAELMTEQATARRMTFGLLGRLLSLLFHGFRPSEEEEQWRFNSLTRAIERQPDAPSSYVMRGEMLLEKGEVTLAMQDFERGLELADPRAESSGWGYIYRALADRATEGLRACRDLLGEDSESA